MFCKECGTENLDSQIECIKCKNIINSNMPLDGTERVMISSFLFLLVTNSFLLGFGLILTFIYLAFFYISKKDKNIKYLNNAKKISLIYVCTLLTISIITALIKGDDNATHIILTVLFTNSIIYFLSDILYFNIIKRHEKWIIDNGLFTDYKGEKSFIEKTSEKIKTIKQEPKNLTDEILKWAELKEKGLISEDEFNKAKEKILEGKL